MNVISLFLLIIAGFILLNESKQKFHPIKTSVRCGASKLIVRGTVFINFLKED